jgi:DNA-binding beta-propeller fold protein YncE
VQASDVTMCGFTGFAGVATVARNPQDGQLYGTVRVASGSGGGLWALTGAAAGARVQPYETPAHVIFDADGNGFITEDNSGNVYRRTPAGVSSLWVAGFHASDDDPFGLCLAPAGFAGPNVVPGDILVTDRGYSGPDEVWAFSAAAAENERLLLADPGEVDIFDLTAGPAGVVYLADDLATGALSVLSPTGTLTTLSLSEPVTGIISLVYDDLTNRIYFLEQATDTLRRVDAATGAVETVASGFAGVAFCGLEIDVAGRRLWVVDSAANRVYGFCLGSASAVGDDPARPGAERAAPGLLAAPRVWPNPLQASATISFALGREADARLEIYDLAGRLVRRLVAGRLPAGERSVGWDGRDDRGRNVAAGLYLMRLSASGLTTSAGVAVVR